MTTLATRRRKSSGFDPLTLSPLAWYKSEGPFWTDSARAIPATADGDKLGAWDDASGNARHVLQATSGFRPTLKLAQANGKACGRFNRVDPTTLLTASSSIINQPLTIVFVVKNPSAAASNENVVGSAAGSNGCVGLNGTTGKVGIYAGSTISSAATPSTTNPFIVAGYLNGASSKGYINGGTADPSGNAGTLGLGGIGLGTYSTASGADKLDADLFEVLVFNSVLSVANLNLLGAHLAAKFGITWSTAS